VVVVQVLWVKHQQLILVELVEQVQLLLFQAHLLHTQAEVVAEVMVQQTEVQEVVEAAVQAVIKLQHQQQGQLI